MVHMSGVGMCCGVCVCERCRCCGMVRVICAVMWCVCVCVHGVDGVVYVSGVGVVVCARQPCF